MDKKEARSILGVNKDADRNDIEKRYAILLKKYRIEFNRLKDEQQEAAAEQAEQAGQQEATEGQAAQTGQTAQTGQATQTGQTAQTEQTAQTGQAAQTEQTAQQKPEQDTAESSDENTAADMSTEAVSSIRAEFDRVTEAYNVLMGYEIKEKDEVPGKAAPLFKAVGIDEKKARNFFYYYKFYILAVILLIGFVIYTVNSCTNRVVPDFNTAFIGRIGYYEAAEPLKESIKAGIPIIKEPSIDGAYIDQTIQGEQLYAMEMKLVVLTAAADMDVFIMDKQYYERFAKQGLFMSLDEIAPGLGVDISKNQELVLSIEDYEDLTDMDGAKAAEDSSTDELQEETSEEPHLYGIDVSNSTVLKESGVIADYMVAAIPLATENQDKAEAFLKFLLN